MMHKHLPMVLATLFKMNGDDHVQPEGELEEVVCLQEWVDMNHWKIIPKLWKVKEVLRGHIKILEDVSECNLSDGL